MIVLKSSRELELMKEACQISAEALMVAGKAVKPGVSTKEMRREDVRSRFCMVLQDTWLFEGTRSLLTLLKKGERLPIF